MNNESAVRFGPGEMEPPHYPGEVAPEDRFAVATPACAPRRECLWLMVQPARAPIGASIKKGPKQNDEWRMTNDETSSNARMTNESSEAFVWLLGFRALSFLRHSAFGIRHWIHSWLRHCTAFVYQRLTIKA